MPNDVKKTKSDHNHIAALDLGSNTCRLLIARPSQSSYKVVDSFSRVIRLGAGLQGTQKLSREAIERAINALKICADKLKKYKISHFRAVATEACRKAKNASAFIQLIQEETGIEIEIISEYEEACLALKGCRGLVDNSFNYILGFDIGGCSTEVMWAQNDGVLPTNNILDWISIPYGIVNLIDSSGGNTLEFYDEIREKVRNCLSSLKAYHQIAQFLASGDVQVIGSSGTTTTVGALYLDLPYYDRTQVDGTIIPTESIIKVAERLRTTPPRERASIPCLNAGRGDVVIGGLAILQGICDTWPIRHITIADRGVRDGILADLFHKPNVVQSVA